MLSISIEKQAEAVEEVERELTACEEELRHAMERESIWSLDRARAIIERKALVTEVLELRSQVESTDRGVHVSYERDGLGARRIENEAEEVSHQLKRANEALMIYAEREEEVFYQSEYHS